MDRSTHLKEKECDLFSFAEIFAISIINAIVLRSGIQPVCKGGGSGGWSFSGVKVAGAWRKFTFTRPVL